MNSCRVPDCDKPRHCESQLCGMHRTRWNRYKTLDAPAPRARGVCRVADCDKQLHGHGLCSMHLSRKKRHGDPLITTPRPVYALAELNCKWQGEDVTYGAAHKRVRTRHGAASLHACIDCGGQAAQWSYNHTDPSERSDAKGRRFSPDSDHYSPRCVPCHRAFDANEAAHAAA